MHRPWVTVHWVPSPLSWQSHCSVCTHTRHHVCSVGLLIPKCPSVRSWRNSASTAQTTAWPQTTARLRDPRAWTWSSAHTLTSYGVLNLILNLPLPQLSVKREYEHSLSHGAVISIKLGRICKLLWFVFGVYTRWLLKHIVMRKKAVNRTLYGLWLYISKLRGGRVEIRMHSHDLDNMYKKERLVGEARRS